MSSTASASGSTASSIFSSLSNMNWDLWINIAAIASPIIGAIAIGVALWVSHRSSRDAQMQIDAIHSLLEVFVASQAPAMLEAKELYLKQLSKLDEQIRKVQQELSIVDPFMNMGGALIDKIERADVKRKQASQLKQLLEQREKIVAQIQLIDNFLAKH